MVGIRSGQTSEAEAITLGAAIIDPKARGKLCSILTADSFFRPANRLIFMAVAEMEHQDPIGQGQDVDQVGTQCKARTSDNEEEGQ